MVQMENTSSVVITTGNGAGRLAPLALCFILQSHKLLGQKSFFTDYKDALSLDSQVINVLLLYLGGLTVIQKNKAEVNKTLQEQFSQMRPRSSK